MHRFLERLDASASTLVPLLYLFGLMLGAASYFAGITLNLGLAVGLSLAAAAELHSFLQQRRARAAWAHLSRLSDTDGEHEQVKRQFAVNAWILVGLLAFSGFNATMFVVETWTPAPGPLWWRIIQYGIRGLIIPVFFFLAGFLVPLQSDASDQLRATSAEMLRRTLKAIDRQWRGRLRRAEKRHADLSPIAIALFEEAGDHAAAKRLHLIAQGLHASETGATYTLTPAPATQHLPPTFRPSYQASDVTATPQRPLSARERRAALLASMDPEGYGQRGHPTSPRSGGVTLDDTTDEFDLSDLEEWDDEDAAILQGQRYPDLNMRSGKRDRAQAAHIAPRGAELAVREFVMPDLPPSKYEREADSDQRRAVFRVLDQALAKGETLTRQEVATRAGVSENTVRSARPLWDTLRSQDKRGRSRKAAPATRELPAVTPDMLTSTH